MRLISDDSLGIVTVFQEAEGEPYEGKVAVAERSKEYKRKWALENKERINNRRKELVTENQDKYREMRRMTMRRFKEKHKLTKADRFKDWRMKSRYGITLIQHNEMKDIQKGQCAICRDKKELVTDHCHTRNKARGLLCRACNLMIGYAHDKIDILESAIHYLNNHDPEFVGCGTRGMVPYEDKHAACS